MTVLPLHVVSSSSRADRRSLDIDDYAAMFGIDGSHRLSLSRHQRTRRDQVLHDTRWLDERDAAGKLIARYRTWNNRSSVAPYRTQFGWERWSLDGRMLDREVRYSTRESVRSLN